MTCNLRAAVQTPHHKATGKGGVGAPSYASDNCSVNVLEAWPWSQDFGLCKTLMQRLKDIGFGFLYVIQAFIRVCWQPDNDMV